VVSVICVVAGVLDRPSLQVAVTVIVMFADVGELNYHTVFHDDSMKSV
jgi:hypothetical protein